MGRETRDQATEERIERSDDKAANEVAEDLSRSYREVVDYSEVQTARMRPSTTSRKSKEAVALEEGEVDRSEAML